MRVNLLKERNQAYSINWMEILVIILVALMVLGLGAHYYYLYTQRSLLQSDVDTLDGQKNILQVKVFQYNKLKDKVDELERIKDKMESLKYVWDRAIIEQGYIVPSKTTLNTLKIEDRVLRLGGMASNNQKVLDLIKKMKLSPVYEEIELTDMRNQEKDTFFSIDAVIKAEEGGK